MIPGAGLKLTIYLGMVFLRGAALSDPNNVIRPVNPSETIRQQVELQMVSAIEPNQPGHSGVFRQVIAQLDSLQWSVEPAIVYPGAVVEKPKEEKTQTAAAEQSPSLAVLQPVPAASQGGTPQICNLDKVDKPVNVLAAADALYQAKDYKRAMRFYQMAVESKPQQKDPAGRQWAMYQAANCMQHQTPEQAIQYYDRLLTECPGSPWASAALTQRKNLDWLKQNQALLLKSTTSNDPNQK